MGLNKQMAIMVRCIETEKLKFAITTLKDVKSKTKSKEFNAILDGEIDILQNQLNMDLDNMS